MKRHSLLDASTARRSRALGDAGERLARDLLQAAGFTQIRNLNAATANYPYADLYAERHSKRYVISVKIRNKCEARTGHLNSRYKLGSKCYELAKRAEALERAEAAWLAISLEPRVLSAYFGSLEQLAGSRGIAMTERAVSQYECIARDYVHGLPYESLRNTYHSIVREAE
jgi:hypothetical protein